MIGKRLIPHTIFILILPVIVAYFGVSTLGAIALVVAGLAWRWVISLSAFVAPAKTPDLELETISASHFAEKVRWSMDRLGLQYTERQAGGTLGAFFLGRTVPRLRMRTGAVRSEIGNSPEILRYLWGAFAVTHADRAAFLQPTAERLELEKKLDRYGVDLQVWVYWHILRDRDLALHAWGVNNPVIPAWQRWLLVLLFPLLRGLIRRSFRITPGHYAKAVAHIDTLLGEMEGRLADGRPSLTGGEEIDFVDITFASLSALWLQPAGFGAGKADAVRLSEDRVPPDMHADQKRWAETFPGCTAFIERLFREERLPQ